MTGREGDNHKLILPPMLTAGGRSLCGRRPQSGLLSLSPERKEERESDFAFSSSAAAHTSFTSGRHIHTLMAHSRLSNGMNALLSARAGSVAESGGGARATNAASDCDLLFQWLNRGNSQGGHELTFAFLAMSASRTLISAPESIKAAICI